MAKARALARVDPNLLKSKVGQDAQAAALVAKRDYNKAVARVRVIIRGEETRCRKLAGRFEESVRRVGFVCAVLKKMPAKR